MKFKFYFYHLFYYQAIILISLGLYLNNYAVDYTTAVIPGWHTTIFPDFWWTILLMAVYTLILGFIYRYWNAIGKPISKSITILHFILTLAGLLFSMNLSFYFTLLLTSNFDISSFAYSESFIISLFTGPVLFLLSFLVFIIGMVKAKRRIG